MCYGKYEGEVIQLLNENTVETVVMLSHKKPDGKIIMLACKDISAMRIIAAGNCIAFFWLSEKENDYVIFEGVDNID